MEDQKNEEDICAIKCCKYLAHQAAAVSRETELMFQMKDISSELGK